MMSINDASKFFIFKVPNVDCLNYFVWTNEIALLDNTARVFQAIFDNIARSPDENIILFVAVHGKQNFSGVCKVISSEMT